MKNPLQLPSSTIVDRPLPKAQLYKKFELKQSQRDAVDADIARLDFVNRIAPQTMPAIVEGTEVKAIFVVEVELKRPITTKKVSRLSPNLSRTRLSLHCGMERKCSWLYIILNCSSVIGVRRMPLLSRSRD